MRDTVDLTVPLDGTFIDRARRFFFAREIPYGMALVRISLPLVILVDVVRRWPFARELYSTDGAIASLHYNFGHPDMLPQFSGPVAVGLFTALTFFLVTSAIGWCTRFSLLAVTGLYFYFTWMDCLSTVAKYTVIANHLTLLLALSNCGDLWSVDAWLRRRRAVKSGADPLAFDLRAPIWPQRLAQILFGMIYFGAAITKMHTPAFFSGDQLVYWMMTYINNEHPVGDYLTQYPLIVSISCLVTFIWELVFFFTVFQPKLRWWVLAVGALFHIGTAFTLGLIIFPLVIVASYLVFLDEGDVRTILSWRFVKRFTGGLSVPPVGLIAPQSAVPLTASAREWFGPAGAFALTTILVCLGGVETEYLMDHYKMRGPGGPLPLQEMADEEVERLLHSPDVNMRQSDKLLAFDLGRTLVGEHLANYRTDFRQGDQLVAQVTLCAPHEDMWLDCVLCGAVPDATADDGRTVPGRLLYKTGQFVLRDAFRSNFFFQLDESMDPGEYYLKLRTGDEEVARKRFTLAPRIGSAAAN